MVFPRPADTTSKVISLNTFPIATIGEDELLSCILQRKSNEDNIPKMSVTWEKLHLQGFVYRYTDGVPDLEHQNSEFRGRTHLFPDVLVTGNASLLLRNVRKDDAGMYTCSIHSSDGGGKINIRLETAGRNLINYNI